MSELTAAVGAPDFPLPSPLCHTHSPWKRVEVNLLTHRVAVVVVKSLTRVRPFGIPWTCCPPGFSVRGMLQARILGVGGFHFLLQGIFMTWDQTLISCISRQIHDHSATGESHQGSGKIRCGQARIRTQRLQ